MNNDFRERRQKSYTTLRMVYDFTMAGLILAMGIILLFGNKFGLPLIDSIEDNMRYGFGGLCILYGGFRLYRGIKHDY
ncbi:MAG: hypothetical protein JO072_02030 [Parafilimonas sp.]|nr:hypothetical protein [Parafilimonas sp.]